MNITTTMLYAGLSGLLLVLLSFNVMYHWVRVTASGQQTDQSMRRAEKLISNFVEQVPFVLILLGFLENGGAGNLAIHSLGATLVAARFLHAFGSGNNYGAGLMRFLGAQATFLVTLVSSIACIYIFFIKML